MESALWLQKSNSPDKLVDSNEIDCTANCHTPLLSLFLTLSAIVVSISPQLTSWLQYDRTAILDGEIWRVFTGHITHWSKSHLFWDVLVFMVLAGIAEWFSRGRYFLCMAVGSLAISLLNLALLPEMIYYRGLSGLDSAMFMLLLAIFYRRNTSLNNMQKMLYVFSAVLFFGKSAYELTTGQALFVQSSGLFIPVPLAHLAGALVGGLVGFLSFKENSSLIFQSCRHGIFSR